MSQQMGGNSMRSAVVTALRRVGLYRPIRYVLDSALNVRDRVAEAYYSMMPDRGLHRYQRMQKKAYASYTKTFEDSKVLCVGAFDEHERYPYEDYLLEHYSQPRDRALDFACGMGRMMNRMLHRFDYVAGVDLDARNVEYAGKYLRDKGWDSHRFAVHQTDGISVKTGDGIRYRFVYSTIALQHIAVHEIRRRIFADLKALLEPNGQCCFQMGFGLDNGVHWLDNRYGARRTNAGLDVSIPSLDHLPVIEKDFLSLGFSKVKFEIKESPHPELNASYHPNWIFIHLWD
jgi:2-polyprenyl-3-methyl-5-hydroxy-6-metoxy-1,4-benzoquinol methylase